MPPLICLDGFGLVWRLTIMTPSTVTLREKRSTSSTLPVLPLSRPAITRTRSSLRIFMRCGVRSPRSWRRLYAIFGMRYITSGASEKIFIKLFSRNSRATGPNTRVPTGSPTSLMRTAALESNRMYVPSLRRVSLRMRTTTQRTTLPFLMLESGAASFTLAVMTSPKPARSPRSPPRGKMHCSLRAPLLSATSRMVRIPIMTFSPQTFLGRLFFLNRLFNARIGFFFERRMIHTDLHGTPDYRSQLPALQFTERPALDDSHHIADLRRLLFIMRIEFFSLADNAFVNRM